VANEDVQGLIRKHSFAARRLSISRSAEESETKQPILWHLPASLPGIE
jgi:hypothetical protein